MTIPISRLGIVDSVRQSKDLPAISVEESCKIDLRFDQNFPAPRMALPRS
jgi:hypothetical protein